MTVLSNTITRSKATRSQITVFLEQFTTKEYSAKQKIIRAGQNSRQMYYLVSGFIKMSTTSADGRSLTLHVFQPGSFFSLLDLILHQTNRYDFETVTAVTLKIVPASKALSFLKANPEVMYDTFCRMVAGLQQMTNRLEESVFGQARHQVANLLLYFVRHFSQKNHDSYLITLKVTHQDIAEWLGLSRENVSLQMKQLEKNGFLSKKANHLLVSNLVGLRQLASNNLSLFDEVMRQ